jgi:hypothetical protein
VSSKSFTVSLAKSGKGTLKLSKPAKGRYRLTLTPTDAAGNVSKATTLTVTAL